MRVHFWRCMHRDKRWLVNSIYFIAYFWTFTGKINWIFGWKSLGSANYPKMFLFTSVVIFLFIFGSNKIKLSLSVMCSSCIYNSMPIYNYEVECQFLFLCNCYILIFDWFLQIGREKFMVNRIVIKTCPRG